MNRICVAIFSSLFALTAPLASQAQEYTLGLGYTDFGETGSDSVVFDFEYRFTPFVQKRVRSHAFGANASISAEGDLFIGAGLWTRFEWDSGWFVESSLMPGLFEEGSDENDLGSTFEIRSLLGVGYRLDSGNAISAAISHKSNASLATDNPGMNAFSVRYHVAF